MNYLNLIAVIVVAYLAVFAQARQTLLRDLFGAQVDLLPSLMVYCALNAGWGVLAGIALLGGLWFDTLSANPLGITSLPLFTVAFIVHWHQDLILREQRYAQFVLGCFASALAPFLTVLLLFGAGDKPLIGWGSLWQWFVMTVIGGVFCPFFFWLFNRLNRDFAYQHLPESTFRSDREVKRGRF
ncbi:MAG: rod shape-determining protein MreD [Verrucomicrobia bacterium]|nr:rod shape-determining protein MreD [Verrucomicrobiota bacterium]